MLTVAANPSSYSMLLSCNPGVFGTDYCCGGDFFNRTQYNENCCSSSFDAGKHPFGSPFAPAVGVPHFGASSIADQFTLANSAKQSGNAVSATSIISPASTTSPGKSSEPKEGRSSVSPVVIGVGLGVPLGVLLLVSIGLLFWRDRKMSRRIVMLSRRKDSVPLYHGADVYSGQPGSAPEPPKELRAAPKKPWELNSKPVAELHSREVQQNN